MSYRVIMYGEGDRIISDRVYFNSSELQSAEADFTLTQRARDDEDGRLLLEPLFRAEDEVAELEGRFSQEPSYTLYEDL